MAIVKRALIIVIGALLPFILFLNLYRTGLNPNASLFGFRQFAEYWQRFPLVDFEADLKHVAHSVEILSQSATGLSDKLSNVGGIAITIVTGGLYLIWDTIVGIGGVIYSLVVSIPVVLKDVLAVGAWMADFLNVAISV